jgi:selenide,water dikinase
MVVFRVQHSVEFNNVDYNLKMVLSDAQTSGGLLMGVNPSNAEKVVKLLIERGYSYTKLVGEVKRAGVGRIQVI